MLCTLEHMAVWHANMGIHYTDKQLSAVIVQQGNIEVAVKCTSQSYPLDLTSLVRACLGNRKQLS